MIFVSQELRKNFNDTIESLNSQSKSLEVTNYVCMYVCIYVCVLLTLLHVCQEELHRRSGQLSVVSGNLTALELQSNSRKSSFDELTKKFYALCYALLFNSGIINSGRNRMYVCMYVCMYVV